jgi:hypothetical protein
LASGADDPPSAKAQVEKTTRGESKLILHVNCLSFIDDFICSMPHGLNPTPGPPEVVSD